MIRIFFSWFILLTFALNANSLDDLVEKIYQADQRQKEARDQLKDYKFRQIVEFRKMDSDGEIEEQSFRDYEILAREPELRKRNLVSARDFEDGQWIDVTQKEIDKEKSGKKKESRGVKFSLSDIFSPENRGDYKFSKKADKMIGGENCLHIYAEPKEEDEDKFKGDLWFLESSSLLCRAELTPSDYPMGVKQMKMLFEMESQNGIMFPTYIKFNATISFLFVFNGQIESEIKFTDYAFNQTFDDAVFEQPVSGTTE